MKLRNTSICVVLCLLTAWSLFAADMISGKWTGDWGPNSAQRNPVSAELKYDGKTVTGSFNPGADVVTISKGTFNEKTGAVHLEADAKAPGGEAIHYVVDGKLANGKITGTWKYQNGSGDFMIKKQ